MQTPVIVAHQGLWHLVSGNTRLMVCKGLRIKPKVVVINTEI
jgi:hypothetical protein